MNNSDTLYTQNYKIEDVYYENKESYSTIYFKSAMEKTIHGPVTTEFFKLVISYGKD